MTKDSTDIILKLQIISVFLSANHDNSSDNKIDILF